MIWDAFQLLCVIFGFWVFSALLSSGLESLYWWYQDKRAASMLEKEGDGEVN
jgi:hypothetical protein